MYIVGIAIGKRHHDASVIGGQGNPQGKSLRFANTHTGFNKLLEAVRKTAGGDEVAFGMEATGHYWLALYTHLRQEGYPVHVINAVQSDALRGMYIRQAKNDSRDSFIIAEVIRFGRFCETAVSAPNLHALRELCRHRFWIVDSVSDLKRKVIALLGQVFPEYEKFLTNTFGKTSLQLLSEYTTPEELLAVDTDKLAAFAGIDPSVKQSGDFTGTRVHMSKRGSPYLRRAIWLPATVAAFKGPAISAYYQRKRAEGKSHLTALGHVSRKMVNIKMVNIIFAILRDNSPYSPAI